MSGSASGVGAGWLYRMIAAGGVGGLARELTFSSSGVLRAGLGCARTVRSTRTPGLPAGRALRRAAAGGLGACRGHPVPARCSRPSRPGASGEPGLRLCRSRGLGGPQAFPRAGEGRRRPDGNQLGNQQEAMSADLREDTHMILTSCWPRKSQEHDAKLSLTCENTGRMHSGYWPF